MASAKALEAKHEKILRGLSRQPENKRCMNCETLGPGYVVIDLRVFVCTTCGGIHRNYGHRVKSISAAIFKPEEVKAMQEGGNLVAEATYLARWSPRDLPKPTDRKEVAIKRWIGAVFQDKTFWSPSPEITQDTKRASGLATTPSGNLVLPVPSPASTSVQAPQDSAPSLIDFGEPSPPAEQQSAAATNGGDSGWAAFGDDPAPAASTVAPAADPWASFGNPAPAQASAAPAGGEAAGWAAFSSSPDKPEEMAAPAAAAASADGSGWASFGSPAKVEEAAPARRELPSDLFSSPTPPAAGYPGAYGAQPQGVHGYGAQPPGVPGYGQPSGVPGYGTPPGGGMPHNTAPVPYGGGSPGHYGAAPAARYGGAVPPYGGMLPPAGFPSGPGAPPAGGNPFGSLGASPAASPVPSPGLVPVGAPAGLPGGNPFSLVSQDLQSKSSEANQDAFTDLVPALSRSLSQNVAASRSSGFAGSDLFGATVPSIGAPASHSDPFGAQSSGFSAAPIPQGYGALAPQTYGSQPPAAQNGFGFQPAFSGQPMQAPGGGSGNPFA